MNTLFYCHPAFAGWIGAARQDITPPGDIYARNWGASRHDRAAGVHRPLTLTALTFQDAPDSRPLVLLAMDGSWWKTHEDEWTARRGVLETFSLDPARVMLHLSHTHAGPSLSRQDSGHAGGDRIAPYLELVRRAAIEATRQALNSHVEATLTWDQGRCGLARDRSYFDEQRQRFLCGFNPVDKADDTLVVGRVTRYDGNIVATLVNYACHPTTLAWENQLISPDFVGTMREIVERHCAGAPCLYLQGASGELAPREQYSNRTEIADAQGRQLGYSVLAVLEGMLPHRTRLEYDGPVESGAPLAIWKRSPAKPSGALGAIRRDVELRLKRIHRLEEIEEKLNGCTDRLIMEQLRRERETRWVVGNADLAHTPLWTWRVGDSFFVGCPDEAFSFLQTELRTRFSPRAVAVMNLVNGGAGGYLPPESLYSRDQYEVQQTPYVRGSLELLVESASKAIGQLEQIG